MHFLLNVAPGFKTAARRHVDLELSALTDRKRPHNTLEDLTWFSSRDMAAHAGKNYRMLHQ